MRQFFVEMVEAAEALDSLRMRGYRAGMSRTKGLSIDTSNAFVPQRNRGDALAEVVRIIDRYRDWYTETVTMRDTGEVIHHCSEPLSQHTGHGSNRRKS
jgi:hypothetical protein